MGCEEKTHKITTALTAVPNSWLAGTSMPQGHSCFHFSLSVSKGISCLARQQKLCFAQQHHTPPSVSLRILLWIVFSVSHWNMGQNIGTEYYGTEMVSVQRRFEQTKAIQTVKRWETERRKMLRMILKRQKKITRKIHWEEALKQVINSWTKCMSYVVVYKFKKVYKWHLRNSFCSYILHHILRKNKITQQQQQARISSAFW